MNISRLLNIPVHTSINVIFSEINLLRFSDLLISRLSKILDRFKNTVPTSLRTIFLDYGSVSQISKGGNHLPNI